MTAARHKVEVWMMFLACRRCKLRRGTLSVVLHDGFADGLPRSLRVTLRHGGIRYLRSTQKLLANLVRVLVKETVKEKIVGVVVSRIKPFILLFIGTWGRVFLQFKASVYMILQTMKKRTLTSVRKRVTLTMFACKNSFRGVM